MGKLDGKAILITGAKGGLGKAVTEAFLASGATVAGASRSIVDADFPNSRFMAVSADLGSAPGARAMVDAALGKWGRIDGLVHVMGGFAGGSRVDETDEATLESMLDVNFRSVFFTLRAVLPEMRGAGRGSISVVASRQGAEAAAMVGAYGASKAAAISLVKSVALENKDRGISANTVLPATMDTAANRAAMPGTDPAKWVQPSQVAELLVYLASAEGAQVTGAAIPVYGGQL
jgi:NAD(P)-dependent dehydrogenase (short-subunit alcohol dehydrogenase family)